MSLPVEGPWPRAVAVAPMASQQLRVRMSDGRRLTLDLRFLIRQREAYWRLRQERYFRQVTVDELGGHHLAGR